MKESFQSINAFDVILVTVLALIASGFNPFWFVGVFMLLMTLKMFIRTLYRKRP